jgi:GLPGLI family protein
LIFICHGQIKSGTVEYGIDFNEERHQQFLKSRNNPGDRAFEFLKKISLNYKKLYKSDIVFIKLKFNQMKYRSDPVDIMIPESVRESMVLRNPTIYGHIKKNIHIKKFKSQGNVFLADIPYNFKWEVKNDYKTIAGYRCRKAILHVKNAPKQYLIAWFTSQIPIAFSPIEYYGLPGAILAVTTTTKHIYAKDIEFKEDVEVEKPTEGIKLTAEEYKEMITRFQPD